MIFIVPEVLHNICNMCGQDLPDMYALTLRLVLHIRQIPPAHVTYITYVCGGYRLCVNKDTVF